jgi:hypothetical protein
MVLPLWKGSLLSLYQEKTGIIAAYAMNKYFCTTYFSLCIFQDHRKIIRVDAIQDTHITRRINKMHFNSFTLKKNKTILSHVNICATKKSSICNVRLESGIQKEIDDETSVVVDL